MTALLFIIVLAVLVLVHELGHYLAARLFKIDVEEFGIGFPPRAWSVKRGGTVWSLNWIPLGGFVRIKGEDKPHAVEPGNFGSKPAGVRALVIGAGVLMNLALASLLFSIGFMIGVPQIADDLPADVKAREEKVQVIETLSGLPAADAGVQPGDVIVSIDGRVFEDVTEIQEYVDSRDSNPVRLELRRGKETLTVEISPRLSEDSGRHVMGVALVETAIVSYPPHVALARGVYATGFYVKEIVVSVAELIRDLVSRQETKTEFSGPLGIAVLTGRAAKLGFTYLLQFVALLSVNLAVVNVLPIPALDGGRLLFIVIEKLRGHAVRPVVEAMMHRIAFFLLLALVALVTLKDIDRYREQILNALKSIFGVT